MVYKVLKVLLGNIGAKGLGAAKVDLGAGCHMWVSDPLNTGAIYVCILANTGQEPTKVLLAPNR
jgi:uncharacterized protein YegJ (DUF2314 family)